MKLNSAAEDQGHDEPLRAAEQLAGHQEQGHQPGHAARSLHVVHGSRLLSAACMLMGSNEKSETSSAPRLARGRRSRSEASGLPLTVPAGPCPTRRTVLTIQLVRHSGG